MNREGLVTVKRAGILFLAVLFLYITTYGACMAVRQRGGPWVVIEEQETNGTPVLRIEHHLRLTNGPVSVFFPGERTADPSVRMRDWRPFRNPNTNAMAFGEIEFVDTTFLPGTIAFDAFGHLIELQPRAMFIDAREYPWVSGTNITVAPGDKLPPERRPKRR